MFKGYVKSDETTVAGVLFGAAAGLAINAAMGNKVRPEFAAAGGAAAALGGRALTDPELKAERKA